MVVQTGAYAYVQYDFETNFDEATCVSCRNKVWGLEQKVSGWTWTNSPIILNQLGSVEVKTYAYGQARGSLSLDYVVSNPWFLSTIFDRNCMACLFPSGCPAPFTYTWCSTASTCTKTVESMSIEVGVEQQVACMDTVRTIGGAIANSITLRSSIGEPVRATADIAYATETSSAIADVSPTSETVGRAACQFEPYTFAHGALTVCNSCCCVTIAELQSFDISLNQNADLLFAHGCNHASSAYRKVFEMTGSFQAPWIDYSQLDKIYAQIEDNCATFAREDPTLTIVLTNGGAGAAARTITFAFTGILLRDHNTAAEPVEPIFETLNWQARSAVVSAINANSAEP